MQTMGNFLTHSPTGMGLASTAVLAALLDQLIARSVLDQSDIALVLENATNALRPHSNILSAEDALAIISKLTHRFQQNA
jgi:hydroxypyruvate isomerase